MKSLIFGLLATTVGITASVVNNGDYLKPEKKDLVITFYQDWIGHYDRSLPDWGICSMESIYPCTILYVFDPNVQSFYYVSKPAGIRIESISKGVFE